MLVGGNGGIVNCFHVLTVSWFESAGGRLRRVGKLRRASVAIHALEIPRDALVESFRVHRDGLALRLRQATGWSVTGEAIIGCTKHRRRPRSGTGRKNRPREGTPGLPRPFPLPPTMSSVLFPRRSPPWRVASDVKARTWGIPRTLGKEGRKPKTNSPAARNARHYVSAFTP